MPFSPQPHPRPARPPPRNHRQGSGIVYCLSRADTEDVAAQARGGALVAAAGEAGPPLPCIPDALAHSPPCMLPCLQIRQYTDISAAHYHAGMTPKQRMQVQNDWRDGRCQVRAQLAWL